MGRIEINTADIPQNRRGTPFTAAEVSQLVQEISERRDIIYGTNSQPAQPHKVRQAWEEIAEIISSLSNIKRSADQCRKRFNDIKRRGQKMVVTKKRGPGRPPKNRPKLEAGEILEPKFEEPEDLEFEPHDFEYEIPAPMDDDDPDYEPSPKKRDLKIVVPKEIPMAAQSDPPTTASRNPSPNPQVSSPPTSQSPSLPKPQSPSLPKPQSPSLPKPQVSSGPKPQVSSVPKPQVSSVPKPQVSSVTKPKVLSMPRPQGSSISKPQAPSNSRPQGPSNSRPQGPSLSKPKVVIVRKPVGSTDPATRQPRPPSEDEKHPFLELQQAGFNMLKKELSGFRDSVMSLNTRLNHLEVALRPIGHIADSLSRIANAVERLTCPPDEN